MIAIIESKKGGNKAPGQSTARVGDYWISTKNLYEADIAQIEAASFMELATTAMKFIMAEGENFVTAWFNAN